MHGQPGSAGEWRAEARRTGVKACVWGVKGKYVPLTPTLFHATEPHGLAQRPQRLTHGQKLLRHVTGKACLGDRPHHSRNS